MAAAPSIGMNDGAVTPVILQRRCMHMPIGYVAVNSVMNEFATGCTDHIDNEQHRRRQGMYACTKTRSLQAVSELAFGDHGAS